MANVKTLTIGDRNYNGTAEIVDTRPDGAALFVTVRELVGVLPADTTVAERMRMRQLARNAFPPCDGPRRCVEQRAFYADGSTHITFRVEEMGR